MCFHYSLVAEKIALAQHYSAAWDTNAVWRPTYHANGFEHNAMPIITQQQPQQIQLYNWGLVPHWVHNNNDAAAIKTNTLNARAESIFEKPSFATSIINQRCLVPATGFFEWLQHQKVTYPHHIFLRSSTLFSFAGIYSTATLNNSTITNTFSIITTTANLLMARIHITKKRMPVILTPAQYRTWLQPNLPKSSIVSMLQPFADPSPLLPEGDMNFTTISRLIGSKSEFTNTAAVLTPATYPELAFL